MARQKIRVSISEIEALRRRLDEAASTCSELPDNILQRFERLLAVAQNPSLQEEAVRLVTELYQYTEVQERRSKVSRRASSDPSSLTVRLEPGLLTALDKFIEKQESGPSRPEAVRMILADALTGYGILQAPESSELNGG